MPGKVDYTEIEIPLDMGDNNKGEMGALKGAGEATVHALDTGALAEKSKVLIFSDSALCIGYLVHGWAFSTWTELGHETRAIFRSLRKRVKVIFYWIRGHAGIPGNERVDGVAKAAARTSARRNQGVEGGGDLRPP